jgi:hypothetical protein
MPVGLLVGANACSVFSDSSYLMRVQGATLTEGATKMCMRWCYDSLVQSRFQATALMLGHTCLVVPPADCTNMVSEILPPGDRHEQSPTRANAASRGSIQPPSRFSHDPTSFLIYLGLAQCAP